MIFVGSNPQFIFKTNKKYTRETFECAITDKFNLILYSNFTAIDENKAEEVAFVVPVHFPSFIRTFDVKIDFAESVDIFFVFKDKESKEALKCFVKMLTDKRWCKLPGLIVK